MIKLLALVTILGGTLTGFLACYESRLLVNLMAQSIVTEGVKEPTFALRLEAETIVFGVRILVLAILAVASVWMGLALVERRE